MALLNVQGELRALLEGALGVTVRTSVPDPRPATLVVVRRTGGARQDRLIDAPTVTVTAYAPTEAEAEELMERVDAAMADLPFASGYCKASPQSMRSDYDLVARSPRWLATYELKTYQPK